MVINGEDARKCFLNPSPKVLADPPMCSLSNPNVSHLYLYIIPLFLLCCPVLRSHQEAFDGAVSLKCTWIPTSPHMLLELLLRLLV